jgi:hypothetical protein
MTWGAKVLRVTDRLTRILLCLCAAFIISFSSTGFAVRQTSVLSSLDDIAGDLKEVPCKRNERLEAVRAQFTRMGANASDITTQKFRGAENLVVKHPGPIEDTIVIGAHYDFVDEGCGAIDNWTGIVAMSHVYKSVRALEHNKTVLFVAFDNEEKGLVGARAMANAIPKEELPRYCAVINLDSFGMAQPFAMANTSSPALTKAASDAASAIDLPFSTAPISGADADSSVFLARKIPAVTLAGVSSNWPSILHSRNDQKGKIDARGVYLGYRLALALWHRVDQAPCGAFRE